MKKILLLAAALVLAAAPLQAEHNDDPRWYEDRFVYEGGEGEDFGNQELTFDFAGLYAAGQSHASDVFETNQRRGTWGLGVGVNYFFHRYLGIGGDAQLLDNDGSFVDNVSASFITRFPFDAVNLAPYLFVGGGRQMDPVYEWTAHIGAGLEFRLNRRTGLFTDARYVFVEDSGDYSLLRAGIRFAF